MKIRGKKTPILEVSHSLHCLAYVIPSSLLLIKSGLGFQCLQPPGRVMIRMIPFWVRLSIRIVCTLVLLVWVPFDKISAKMKILNPGHRREGTYSLYYMTSSQPG